MSKKQSIRLSEIATLVGGRLTGNADVIISSVAKIDEAGKGDITFLYLSHYEKFFASTGASAILVKPDFNKSRNDISYIEVDSPEKAFASVIINFFSPELKLNGIDKTAFVGSSSSLGENVA